MNKMFTEGILYILYHWIDNYNPYLLIYSMKKLTEGLPLEYAENWEMLIFHIYFFNMDFLLIMRLRDPFEGKGVSEF